MGCNSYFHTFELHFCDCDKNKIARIETILRYVADVAGIDYTHRGYSHDWLLENGFAFLLSRVAISILRMPESGERVKLETWERDVKGAVFYREVIFYDEDGEIIINASTGWSLVDPIKRSILKPSAFTGEMDLAPNRFADCIQAPRLNFEGDFEEVGNREVVYSDIDGNNHLYNAVYSGIACDFLPDDVVGKKLVNFIINFKKEAVLHDTLLIKRQIEGNKARVVGEIDERISFKCEFEYEYEE